jgi:hypothetical protein
MAHGPDPNRWQPADPEAHPREPMESPEIGDQRTSRLGLSSTAITVLAVILAVVLLAIFLL